MEKQTRKWLYLHPDPFNLEMKSGQVLITLAIIFSATQAIALIAQKANQKQQARHIRQQRDQSEDDCSDSNENQNQNQRARKNKNNSQSWKDLQVNWKVDKNQSKSDQQPKNLVKYQGGKKNLNLKIPVNVIGKKGDDIVHPLIIEQQKARRPQRYHHNQQKYEESFTDDEDSDLKAQKRARKYNVGDAN